MKSNPGLRSPRFIFALLLCVPLMGSKNSELFMSPADDNFCKSMDAVIAAKDSDKPYLYYGSFVSHDSATGRDCHYSTITITPGGTGYLYTNGIGYVGSAYEESVGLDLTFEAAKTMFDDYFSRLKQCSLSEEFAMTTSDDETLHADNFKTVNDAMGEWSSVCLDMYNGKEAGKYEIWISIDYFIPTGE